ncbi:MAG: hypothetical protein MJY85_10455 [Fibrobacter sp.]|nr:hypothetical protein [Fibrobacter sp.]
MKKLLMLGLSAALFAGCAHTYYSNQDLHTASGDAVNYKNIQPNLTMTAKFKNKGCPVNAFYEAFSDYDDIVDITITERYHFVALMGLMLGEHSLCEYKGTGVYFKDGFALSKGPIEADAPASKKKAKKAKSKPKKDVEEEEEEE